VLRPGDEIRRKRGQAGPDLDDVIAEFWIYSIKNPRDVMRIDEKILTEAASGDMSAPFDFGLRHYGRRFAHAMDALSPIGAASLRR